MSWIIKDWTKDIVPRVNDNNLENGKKGNKSSRSFDYISIRSYDEIKRLSDKERQRSYTDFAFATGNIGINRFHVNNDIIEYRTQTGKLAGDYFLRSFGPVIDKHFPSRSVTLLDGDLSYFGHGDCSNYCPSLSLRLASKITPQNVMQEIGEIREVTLEGKTSYHTIELGEYPKTKVSDDLSEKLELMYNGGHLQGELKCTGKLFTTNWLKSNSAFGVKENPEFKLNGERYVRAKRLPDKVGLFTKDDQPEDVEWFKVEPITFRISNYKQITKGKAKTLELDSDEIILSGIPFQAFMNTPWQESLIRAFLNGSKTGNYYPEGFVLSNMEYDLTNRGFLYQAFNMTRKPTREYTFPRHEGSVGQYALSGCVGIETIIIPSNIHLIRNGAFSGCVNSQIVFTLGNVDRLHLEEGALQGTAFKYVYISKDSNRLILSPREDKSLDDVYLKLDFDLELTKRILEKSNNTTYRKNIINVMKWKQEGVIKFIPPDYTLKTFPESQLDKYFLHGNNLRWGRLVKTLGFDKLYGNEKENSLTDLMKIYYAIGGFSDNQGECEKAYKNIFDYVAKTNNPNATASDIGAEIHSRFSGLNLNGPYNPEFAEFFMRYYKVNPDFMKTCLHEGMDEVDYLCQAHNAFKRILSLNPNRTVNGNTRNSLLSPEFILKNLFEVEYTNIQKGNEELAKLMGSYAYDQSYFDEAQEIFNKAKADKDKAFLCAERASHKNGLSFRLLEKDDPLGFVIGNITTCCQRLDDENARTCVIDGYLNPNAGFMVFEQDQFDNNGKAIGKKIVGQAYVWYDPKTKTVCYDNIEVPNTLVDKLFSGDKKQGETFTSENFIDTVIESADAIMRAMNVGGNIVERVTTGEQYNDLKDALNKKFGRPETKNLAVHRDYSGYSDAKEKQFLIRTYDQTTKDYANKINQLSDEIGKDLNVIEANTKSDSIDKRWG